MIWHTDAKIRVKVDECNAKCITIVRGADVANLMGYQNGTRVGPIERRYRADKKRLARLKALKRELDPTAILTTQLLE